VWIKVCGSVVSSLQNINFCQFWGDAYGNSTTPTAHAFAMSSHAIEQQFVMMDGLLGSEHLTHAVHGVQSWNPPTIHLPSAQEHPLFYVGVYSALGLGSAFVGILSAIVQYTGALRASKVLFLRLLVSVVRATMRWHDTTPQGTPTWFHLATIFTVCLTRSNAQSFQQGEKNQLELTALEMTCFQDIETVDSSLASSLQAVNSSLATFAASIITVASVFPSLSRSLR
jgi:ABC-type multidrug transport system fused ATPase/permease subunit